ncbi:hypothetical protein ABZX85_37930 [Streptomyces sp. NPDC004539]|uniref:hypothetical protein n=1 Tax=Streptomyces sp. NPDC004539 TaxID=3154280 RepID=UPI0033ADB069
MGLGPPARRVVLDQVRAATPRPAIGSVTSGDLPGASGEVLVVRDDDMGRVGVQEHQSWEQGWGRSWVAEKSV